MLTLNQAKARVEAAEYDHDIAHYDRGRGIISEREYQRACVILEDAKLDLASVEARVNSTPSTAILTVRGVMS